jgi:hypothetical protein
MEVKTRVSRTLFRLKLRYVNIDRAANRVAQGPPRRAAKGASPTTRMGVAHKARKNNCAGVPSVIDAGKRSPSAPTTIPLRALATM